MAEEVITPEAPVVRGFEALSDPAFMNAPTKEPINIGAPAAGAVLNNEPIKVETPVAPVINADGTTTPAAAVVDPNVDVDAVEQITEFKIAGVTPETVVKTPEQILQETAIAKLETEQSWTNLAATKGITLTDDTFEAYSKSLDAHYEAEKVASIEAVKKAGYDLELNKLPIEAVAIIEGAKQGLSYEDVMAPVRQIDNLLALTNEELVAEDLRLQNVEGQTPIWTEELIEKQIADLVESDKLDLAAAPLRTLLTNNKQRVAQDQVNRFAQLQQQRVEHEKQVRVSESEAIKSTITSMKEYMGVPINDELVSYAVKNWNEGKYHELMKDPKAIAAFIMNTEFGEQGKKALANREYQRGRDEKANKLHNIPPVSKTGTVVSNAQQSQKAEGNWGALKR